jgi:14-3-3 protein beta/theta/zeta
MYRLCNKIVDLIDSKLMSKATDVEAKVFFHKTKADYFRYMSEVTSGERLAEVSEKALQAYNSALSDSETVGPADPIKLGLYLNFSVFYYEVKNDHKQACELAKKSFDEAINQLDNLDEDKYKDAATILQLLRDNLTLWTAENEGEDNKDGDDNVIDL